MKDEATGIVGSSISWLLTVSQANQVFELIQIILSSIVSLITICYIVYKWYKKATKEDSDGGKDITLKEIEELKEEVEENVSKSKREDL